MVLSLRQNLQQAHTKNVSLGRKNRHGREQNTKKYRSLRDGTKLIFKPYTTLRVKVRYADGSEGKDKGS
jgi:hypothetical protein